MVRLEGIGKLEIFSDLIGNRTRDITCQLRYHVHLFLEGKVRFCGSDL
jgi:hypothetical protein